MYEELSAPLPDGRAYAERIGLPWPLRPDLETLDRIILAHQCTVPFENLEPYDQGREPSLGIETLFDKVVRRRRGGFCFELNALLDAFLREIGYEAWSVSCRIVRARDYLPPMLHRAVLARLDKQLYYCDVGYGGPQPPGPVPLGGDRTVCGERFRVVAFCEAQRREPWWRLERSAGEGTWEKLIEFPEMPLPASYFVPYAFYSARHPDSLFSQKRILNLRTAAGSLALTGTTLTERRNGEAQVTQAGSREELAEMIRQKFGFTFPADALRWEE